MARIFLTTALLIVSFVGLIVVVFALVLVTSPDVKQIQTCFTTSMFKVELCPTGPNYVRLDNVSQKFIDALLISEDVNFYNHDGFDFFEIQESIKANLSQGKIARGGSTITQQLVKNAFLEQNKSIIRKLREAYLTYQIEKLLGKKQILERYVNVVEFGPNLYGLKAAAQFYYKKSPADLSLIESCFLVMLLPAPEKNMSSFKRGELSEFARERIQTILFKLKFFKRIDESEYQAATVGLLNYDFKAKSEAAPQFGTSPDPNLSETESETAKIEDPPPANSVEEDQFEVEENSDKSEANQ